MNTAALVCAGWAKKFIWPMSMCNKNAHTVCSKHYM